MLSEDINVVYTWRIVCGTEEESANDLIYDQIDIGFWII